MKEQIDWKSWTQHADKSPQIPPVHQWDHGNYYKQPCTPELKSNETETVDYNKNWSRHAAVAKSSGLPRTPIHVNVKQARATEKEKKVGVQKDDSMELGDDGDQAGDTTMKNAKAQSRSSCQSGNGNLPMPQSTRTIGTQMQETPQMMKTQRIMYYNLALMTDGDMGDTWDRGCRVCACCQKAEPNILQMPCRHIALCKRCFDDFDVDHCMNISCGQVIESCVEVIPAGLPCREANRPPVRESAESEPFHVAHDMHIPLYPGDQKRYTTATIEATD